jgi:hypothetical protein
MKEITGNLFDQTWADAICITTNGFIKRNGEAVMGRGCAATATRKFPTIASELGKNLMSVGNLPTELVRTQDYTVFSFPVKRRSGLCSITKNNVVSHMKPRFKPNQSVPGWALVADKQLIISSAESMMEAADRLNLKSIVIPRPGCGAGELSWEDIGPALHKVLDDRFFTITFK